MTRPNFVIERNLYTRSELQNATGADAQLLDYWSKGEIIRPVSGGGGKGQHRQFDAYEVTKARIFFELHKLGVGGKPIKELAGRFDRALQWFRSHELAGLHETVAGCLIEFRIGMDEKGRGLVPDSPHIQDHIRLSDFSGKTRKIDWDTAVAHHQNLVALDLHLMPDRLVEECRDVSINEYVQHRGEFFALSPKSSSTAFCRELYLAQTGEGRISTSFDEPPADAVAYIVIDIARLKAKLWGWP